MGYEDVIKADRLFRNQQYQDALNSYNDVADSAINESLKKRAKISSAQCRRQLGQTPGRSYFRVDKNLKEELQRNAMNRAEPKYINGQGPLIIDSSQINARELVNRFAISPFQISLILVTAKLIEELKIVDSIKRDLELIDDYELSLGDILSCVIDPRHAKLLELSLTRNSRSSNICWKTINRLQALFKRFRHIESLSEMEHFLRKHIKEKIANLWAEPENSFNNNKRPTSLIYAGSIFLNESKFLERCVENHYEMISKWCFVEGTCLGYPTKKVNINGFSKDLSSLVLQLFPDPEDKLRYIAHGWTENEGEDAKSELRNRYLKGATGDVLVVIDIDEFYPKKAFNHAVAKILEGYDGVIVPQIHFWKSLKSFIVGGYYDISHMRFFKMHKGLKYIQNHNFPEIPDGTRLDKKRCFKFAREISSKNKYTMVFGVYCYHMGFAKDADDMRDKTDYYINRGERITRPDTTRSRAAWFTDELPENCKILPFNQPLYGVLAQ